MISPTLEYLIARLDDLDDLETNRHVGGATRNELARPMNGL